MQFGFQINTYVSKILDVVVEIGELYVYISLRYITNIQLCDSKIIICTVLHIAISGQTLESALQPLYIATYIYIGELLL